MRIQYAGLLEDPPARTLVAGDLEAVFLPSHGMFGASLRHKGVEMLRRIDDLEVAAASGSTAGIPLLYPWANRLAGSHYRAAGRELNLNLSSPLLHLDAGGLPMHGVPWFRLAWKLNEAKQDFLAAELDWSRRDLLSVFPFPHHLEMAVHLSAGGLTIETTLIAGPDNPVPVSFGFHPYFGLPGASRAQWHLELPAMRKLLLDSRGIPTGVEEPFQEFKTELGENSFDDGFALMTDRTSFSIAGGGCRITVEFLAGYRYVQVFAPKNQNYIAIEPMTAPTSALTSGRGLRLVKPGERFQAVFRICIEAYRSVE